MGRKIAGVIMLFLGSISVIAFLCTIYLASQVASYLADPFTLPVGVFAFLSLFLGINSRKKWVPLPMLLLSITSISFIVWSIWTPVDPMGDNFFLSLFRIPFARISLLLVYSIIVVIMTKEVIVKNK